MKEWRMVKKDGGRRLKCFMNDGFITWTEALTTSTLMHTHTHAHALTQDHFYCFYGCSFSVKALALLGLILHKQA